MANDTNKNQIGAFIPTSDVYDVISDIYASDVNSVEFKELLVRMYQNLNRMATLLNMKDTGYYDTQEFVCGQVFFPEPGLTSQTSSAPVYRQVYRKVINFGTLPNAATKSVPHNINFSYQTQFVRAYGVATDPNTGGSGFFAQPIPYASANNPTTGTIELLVDANNVNVITNGNQTPYTRCYIILEYIQQ